MKPHVFIGSSREQLETAYVIQQSLEYDCEPTVWDQGIFQLNSNSLDDLLTTLDEMDFGIFVFAPEDSIRIRGLDQQTTRDNVILEFGLFIGWLGKERTFFVMPRESGNDFRLPSDLIGVKPAAYDASRPNRRAALGPACNEIRSVIKRMQSRNGRMLDIIQTQKDVYTYVFNRLNPYQDISLTSDFLRNLPANTHFARIDDVLYPLDSLIHHYVPHFIDARMRVYFAYKLDEPREVSPDLHPKHERSFQAYYRVGISFSKNDPKWYEGLPIGIPSNTNRVYSRKTISKVRNAQRQIDSRRVQNEEVDDEGSVIAVPVLYSDGKGSNECVGVIGISSPYKEEATKPEYEFLANELSILFQRFFMPMGSIYICQKHLMKL
jgi:hypothetical protein